MTAYMVFASIVWAALIFGPKSACLMAVNNEMASPDGEVHHRSRRAVLTSHQIMISATPFLTTSYYFNKNELITFKIRLAYNGTGTSYTNVNVRITSEWIDMSLGSVVKDMFDTGAIDGNSAVLTEASLDSNKVIIGNVSGVVKSTIGPLATLELNLEVNATQGADQVLKHTAKSHPTLYGVFPEVNTTRSNVDTVSWVYDEIDVSMKVLLPELTASLLMELTTNIEDYVFMEVKDVTVTSGTAITSTVTPAAKYHSSQVNNEYDRVEIDFGNVTVANNIDDAKKTITVDYKVKINDHPEVLNNSKHYFGAGIQVGPKILWVEQYDALVFKEEPALVFDVTVSNNNGTRLYIDDIVEFTWTISHHENTSLYDASDVAIGLSTDYLAGMMQEDGDVSLDSDKTNDTYFYFDVTSTLETTKSLTGKIKMKVGDKITPLQNIKADFELMYTKKKNSVTTKKRPVLKKITSLVTATPIIDFTLKSGNTTFSPGKKNTFQISISLLKMTSPLDIELVMPKAEGYPIMTITDFKLVSVGSNVQDVDQSAKATNRSTTFITDLPDQSVLKLGHAKQITSNQDIDANKIIVEFTAYMNDFDNVTDGAKYWVGAGVIGKPKMVWVGQIQVEAAVATDAMPRVAINMSYSADTDQYQYDIDFQHSEKSDQIAYNVSFEYYLPPYVEFVRDISIPDGVTKVPGTTRYKVDKEIFYFTDYVGHAIEVRLNRDKSPKSGTFEFVVPLRVSFQDRIGNWREYFRAVNRSIQVLPKRPTIPKDSRAKEHYYGRGFYWNKAGDKSFYVCMNQHVPTAVAACYKLHSDNQHFTAVDRRIGCILGHATDQKLYGLARNQITVMVFDTTDNDWFPLPDNELPSKTQFSFKNLEGTTSVGPMDTPAAGHEDTDNNIKWQGTGDGLYHQQNGGSWTLKAKWHLEE